jgi:hypothetical protein
MVQKYSYLGFKVLHKEYEILHKSHVFKVFYAFFLQLLIKRRR